MESGTSTVLCSIRGITVQNQTIVMFLS